jgi:hypothetical protein
MNAEMTPVPLYSGNYSAYGVLQDSVRGDLTVTNTCPGDWPTLRVGINGIGEPFGYYHADLVFDENGKTVSAVLFEDCGDDMDCSCCSALGPHEDGVLPTVPDKVLRTFGVDSDFVADAASDGYRIVGCLSATGWTDLDYVKATEFFAAVIFDHCPGNPIPTA